MSTVTRTPMAPYLSPRWRSMTRRAKMYVVLDRQKKLDTRPVLLINIFQPKAQSTEGSILKFFDDYEFLLAPLVFTALAFFTRMWKIGLSDIVTWDEAQYVIAHTSFFSHSPKQKMLIAPPSPVSGNLGPTTSNANSTLMSILPSAKCWLVYPAIWLVTTAPSSSSLERNIPKTSTTLSCASSTQPLVPCAFPLHTIPLEN